MRRVFFSFHYERDVWRAEVVRNSQVVQAMKATGWSFYDAADREKVRRSTPQSLKSWIDNNMKNTSVTVVLIGAQTAERYWVRYEIDKSLELDKGLLGVRIHALKNQNVSLDKRGANPLPAGYTVYDWHQDQGHVNLGRWIEQAAQAAGR